MMRSMPDLSVSVDTGHVPHAPTSVTLTMPVFVDVAQHDVAPVGLQRRTDHFDGGFHLLSHVEDHSISARSYDFDS
jgi:hypothetical protein